MENTAIVLGLESKFLSHGLLHFLKSKYLIKEVTETQSIQDLNNLMNKKEIDIVFFDNDFIENNLFEFVKLNSGKSKLVLLLYRYDDDFILNCLRMKIDAIVDFSFNNLQFLELMSCLNRNMKFYSPNIQDIVNGFIFSNIEKDLSLPNSKLTLREMEIINLICCQKRVKV